MYFTHRPAKNGDLENCFSLLLEKQTYVGKSKVDLLALWSLLIREEACVSVVLEDRRLPVSERVVGFGFTYFLADDFLKRVKTHLPPFPVKAMLRKYPGRKHPYLLKKEIEKAPRGEGVTLFTPHYGWDQRRLSKEDAFHARSLLQECFMSYHAGFKIKEMLMEAHGPQMRDLQATAGMRVRRDYKEFKGSAHWNGLANFNQPYLMGCTAAEAMKQPGTSMALLWSKHSPPRFAFSVAEKKMLEKALEGETDEDISSSLNISTWTVKKRWQSVYGKVSGLDPDILRQKTLKNAAPTPPTRQRRRKLTDYLRDHLEELRSTIPTPGSTKS